MLIKRYRYVFTRKVISNENVHKSCKQLHTEWRQSKPVFHHRTVPSNRDTRLLKVIPEIFPEMLLL